MTDMRQFVATPTVEELEAEIERLTTDYRDASNKIHELMAVNKSHHAEIERLQAEHDGVVALYNASVKRVEQLQGVVDAAKQELRDVGSGPGWIAYRILKEAEFSQREERQCQKS